jgi:hypothetical protein
MKLGSHALLSRGWGFRDKRSVSGLTTKRAQNDPFVLQLTASWRFESFSHSIIFFVYGKNLKIPDGKIFTLKSD